MLVNLFLTLSCNLKCSYCYATKPTKSSKMTAETALVSTQLILDTAKELNVKTLGIGFSGGEPLLCWDTLQTIVETVQKRNDIAFPVSFIMTTNGTLLTPKIIQAFEQYDFNISLSLDGSQSVHDTHRRFHNGKGSFACINAMIPPLLEARPKTVARITLTPETVTSLAQTIKFSIDSGFDYIKPVPDYFDKRWTAKNIDQCEKEFKKILAMLPEYWQSNRRVEIGLLEHRLERHPLQVCQAGLTGNQFTIGPKGNIYPCSYLVGDPSFIIGDVYHGLDHHRASIAHCTHQQPFTREACQGCTLFDTCDSARCTFVNLLTTGKMDQPSPFYCTFERMLFHIVREYRQLKMVYRASDSTLPLYQAIPVKAQVHNADCM